MAKIFVYGTLMRGQCRAHVLRDQRSLGLARTEPQYLLYETGSYPAMVRSKQGVEVEGEVWEVSIDCLDILDGIEGVPDLYSREPVRLKDPPLQDVQAYLYRQPTTGMALCGKRWAPTLGPLENAAPDLPLFVAQQGNYEFTRQRTQVDIVCVGDSITGWNNFGPPENWPFPTYPRFLQLLCSPQGNRVVDGGIAGEVSPAGPRHVSRYLEWFVNATWYVIGFGTNDLGMSDDVRNTSERIVEHMRAMASRVASRGKNPIFLNVPHPNSRYFPTTVANRLRGDRVYHNQQLAKFCDSAHIPLVDICTPLNDDHFGDALHPNETGARIIAETVFRTLRQRLATRQGPPS
jgi:gamma-glutamylaminecyclotransferase